MRRHIVAASPTPDRPGSHARSNVLVEILLGNRRAAGRSLLRLTAAMAMMAAGAMAVAPAPARAQSATSFETSSGWRATAPKLAPAAPPHAGAPARTEIELRPLEDAGEKVEAGRESIRDGRISSERVTDMMVRLRPHTRTFRSAAASAGKSPTLVGVLINVVIHGRISPAAAAECDRFDGDMLVCTVECDGGSFGLRRGPGAADHVLMVGIDRAGGTTGVSGAPARAGFKLGACLGRDAPALMVMPRGGRLSTEIRFSE